MPNTLFKSADDFAVQKIINPDMAIEVIHFVIIEFHSTLKINVLSINTPNHNVEKIIDNSMHVNCHWENQSSESVFAIPKAKHMRAKMPITIKAYDFSDSSWRF